MAAQAQAQPPVYSYRNVDLAHGDNYFVDVYHFTLDLAPADIRLRTSEATDFRIATWDEIASLDEAGIFLHYGRLREALAAERNATP